jgi:hypothetical protein
MESDLELNPILRWRVSQRPYPLPPITSSASTVRARLACVVNQLMYCHKLFDSTQFRDVLIRVVLRLLQGANRPEDEDSNVQDGLNSWIHYFLLAPTPSKICQRRDSNELKFGEPWMSLKELITYFVSTNSDDDNSSHRERSFLHSSSSTVALLHTAARVHNERGELPLHLWIKQCRTVDPARVLLVPQEGPPSDNEFFEPVEPKIHRQEQFKTINTSQPESDQNLAGDGTWLLLEANPAAASTPQQGGTNMYPFMLAAASSFDDVVRNSRRGNSNNFFSLLPPIDAGSRTAQEGSIKLNPPCLTTTFRLLQEGGLDAIIYRSTA